MKTYEVLVLIFTALGISIQLIQLIVEIIKCLK